MIVDSILLIVGKENLMCHYCSHDLLRFCIVGATKALVELKEQDRVLSRPNGRKQICGLEFVLEGQCTLMKEDDVCHLYVFFELDSVFMFLFPEIFVNTGESSCAGVRYL